MRFRSGCRVPPQQVPPPPCPRQLHPSSSDRSEGLEQRRTSCHGSVHLSEPAAAKCVKTAFSRGRSAHQLAHTPQNVPAALPESEAVPAAGCTDDALSASRCRQATLANSSQHWPIRSATPRTTHRLPLEARDVGPRLDHIAAHRGGHFVA